MTNCLTHGNARPTRITIRVSDAESEKIKRAADKLASGNVSMLLRYAIEKLLTDYRKGKIDGKNWNASS